MLKIAWKPNYVHPLPEKHRFPMIKYELLPEQLLYEGTVSQDNFFAPGEAADSMILAAHDAEYWRRLKGLELTKSEIRKSGFPLSAGLVEREITIAQGTMDCTQYAFENGIAMNIAGGTHHAFTDRGEGFCLLNDQGIAAYYLLNQNLAKKILIIDLDVHQGNGTAEIFGGEDRVFTFSMHGAKNYPMHKEQSDLDIGLPDHTTDDFYLKTLEVNLKNLIQQVEPDFLFYQSGVDILSTDKLGRLKVSIQGCKERDRMVLQTAKDNQLPMVVSMGGGYSEEIKYIIEAHANTYRLAQEIYF
ncbi:histone deacetylase [Fulvivirga maritima]|uniref:histone deacetylase family protein n=1 Tax=Fulvivirga maritima TaxID=2904247 RepID=UPI001F30D7B7|nr:histone deacetylase [Fulvivirga maritima]UII25206.1 histone deacetylase [Fulvivirga maritima]